MPTTKQHKRKANNTIHINNLATHTHTWRVRLRTFQINFSFYSLVLTINHLVVDLF